MVLFRRIGRRRYARRRIGTRFAKRIHGRGSYTIGGRIRGIVHRYRRFIPRLAGAAISSAAGYGWAPGWNAGAGISRILGYGAYRRSGALVHKGNLPTMHPGPEGILKVKHKELVFEVRSSDTNDFNIVPYDINPGLYSAFPWLSNLARNYQQYNINGLVYIYQPSTAEGSADGLANTGLVLMCNTVDMAAHEPITYQQMMQQQFSVNGKPTKTIVMPVEQHRNRGGQMTKQLLVRSGPIPFGATPQLYDDCRVYIGTYNNGVANATLGHVYVTYDITFYNPKSRYPGDDAEVTQYEITSDPEASDFLLTCVPRFGQHDDYGVTRTAANKFTLRRGIVGTFIFTFYWANGVVGVTQIPYIAIDANQPYIGEVESFGLFPGEHGLCAPENGSSMGRFMRSQMFTITDPNQQCAFTLTEGLWGALAEAAPSMLTIARTEHHAPDQYDA